MKMAYLSSFYHNSNIFIIFIRMNNQNNPYPDVSHQPLLNNNQPQSNPSFNYPQNPNAGGYAPPPYPQGGNYPPPPPNHNNNYGPNPVYVPNNQVFLPPGGQGFIPSNQPFIPGRGLMCPICRRETDNFPKKVPGGVTWIWCFGLFIFTGICCCIPFCVDSCLDTQLVCVVCQCVKARQEANCC